MLVCYVVVAYVVKQTGVLCSLHVRKCIVACVVETAWLLQTAVEHAEKISGVRLLHNTKPLTREQRQKVADALAAEKSSTPPRGEWADGFYTASTQKERERLLFVNGT